MSQPLNIDNLDNKPTIPSCDAYQVIRGKQVIVSNMNQDKDA